MFDPMIIAMKRLPRMRLRYLTQPSHKPYQRGPRKSDGDPFLQPSTHSRDIEGNRTGRILYPGIVFHKRGAVSAGVVDVLKDLEACDEEVAVRDEFRGAFDEGDAESEDAGTEGVDP